MDDPSVGSIDILVTDVVMPRLSGVQLAIELRRRWPTLPILLCSGQHTEESAAEALRPPFEALSKPVPQQVLAQTIRRMLED